jgi:hypothetical protein
MEIIERGKEGYLYVADYYFRELLKLKERTENLIKEFVEQYINYINWER